MVSEEHCAILLMDRDDQDAALITQYLTAVDSNVDVRWEKDCPAVLDFVKASFAASISDSYLRPRLIILSIEQLTNEVIEVLEFLKQDADLKKVPLLIISKSSKNEDIKRSYDLKVNSYLLRPDSDSEFADILKEVAEYWLKWNQLPS